MRTRLNVPKGQEDIALSRGALYDKEEGYYYVPKSLMISMFQEFVPLTIELVPSTSWYNNVRSEAKEDWDKIRRKSYKQANYRCEICSGVGPNHPVECHEIWVYDAKRHKQKLTGLISLCPDCHKAKHIGLAYTKGEEKEVIEHIKKVNQWTEEDVKKYLYEVFLIYDLRSAMDWELDIEYIKEFLQE